MNVGPALQYLQGFLDERMPQSSARLVEYFFALCGGVVGVGTLVFAFRHPDNASTVTALALTTAAFIVNGCVALFTRTKSTDVIVAQAKAEAIRAPTTTTTTTLHPPKEVTVEREAS